MNEKKIKFSLLVSIIFLFLLGIPIYGVLYHSAQTAAEQIEVQLKKGNTYAAQHAKVTVEQFINQLQRFKNQIRKQSSVIEAFESSNENLVREELIKIYDNDINTNIDFLFADLSNKTKTINISSSLFDTDLIAKNLSKSIIFIEDEIFIKVVDEESPVVFAYVITPILSSSTGEVLGNIKAGIILNNNMPLFERVRDSKELSDIQVHVNDKRVFHLYPESKKIEPEIYKSKKITIRKENVYTPFQLSYRGSESIFFTLIYKSNSFQKLKADYRSKQILFFVIILSLALIFFIIFNTLITSPLKRLVQYTKLDHSDLPEAKLDFGIIEEFQHLGEEFYLAFNNLAKLNQGLEEEVRVRTIEIEEKREVVEKQLKELVTLQERMIAQEKLTSLGLLLAGVSHEIRNPLNLIQNSAFIIKEVVSDIQKTESQEEKLNILQENLDIFMDVSNIIIQQSLRSTRIINSMLDQSRGVSSDLDKANLKEVIEMNLNFVSKSSTSKLFNNITVETDFQDIDDVYIYERELGQVLVNLFENSFYALGKKLETQGNEYHPKLTIRLEILNNDILITIHDNGIGIPRDILPDIFSAFKTTKPAGEGTGLGLSVSMDIIKKHNGTMTVESEEGKYTEFKIIIPMNLK